MIYGYKLFGYPGGRIPVLGQARQPPASCWDGCTGCGQTVEIPFSAACVARKQPQGSKSESCATKASRLSRLSQDSQRGLIESHGCDFGVRKLACAVFQAAASCRTPDKGVMMGRPCSRKGGPQGEKMAKRLLKRKP